MLSLELIEHSRLKRQEGLSYKSIARELKISPASVMKYSKDIELSKDQKQKLLMNEHLNRKKFASVFSQEKDITIPELNQNLASVLGHLFFDGSVSPQNSRYTIKYTNASLGLIKKFNKNVSDLFGLEVSYMQKNEGINCAWYEIYFYSKKLCEFLSTFSSSYSTSDNIGIPPQILSSNDSVKSSFLQAFWDDEGCIDAGGRLSGSSVSEKMIDDLVFLHREFGITCKKYPSKRKRLFEIKINSNYSNFSLFNEKVGFTLSKVIRGKNIGKSKRSLLHAKLEKYRKRLKPDTR